MKLISFKSFLCCLLPILTFLLPGCFSTLQTAKTTDGFSFTSGLYTYSTEKHRYPKPTYDEHLLLILMPRYGRIATEEKLGLDFGLRIISDAVDTYEGDKPFFVFGEEFKVQIPRNRYLDLALGVDFWFLYPGSLYIIASKDLSKTFTLYGSSEIFGGLYIIALGENERGFYNKSTLGSEINFSKHFSTLIEIERWFNTGWSSRENTRFAIGIKACPAK